jgi:SAM-dependent MidA family methyltransferase
MRHAPRKIQEIIENKALPAEQVRALKELFHPQHMGQKFQVLHGWR